MILTQQQINNLITGREMTVELPASKKGLRRFMQINGYERGDGGELVVASKVVKRSKYETVFFWVRVYELTEEYIENHWDVLEEELTSYQEWDGIQGIVVLEVVLKEHLQDSSMMGTSDKTDYPL